MKHAVALVAIFLFLITSSVVAAPAQNAKTIENIKAAITGETTASAKYAAYAKKAREEGYNNIALLFEAASKSESIHANNHRAVLEQLGEKLGPVTPKFEVKATMENLQDALNGETYEVTTMYPDFMKEADGKVSVAMISYNYAYRTEQKHKALYENALAALKAGKEKTLATKYFVCTTCGNTYDNEAAARCGICLTPKERYVTIGA